MQKEINELKTFISTMQKVVIKKKAELKWTIFMEVVG